MRLFVAVEISDETRQAAAAVAARLRSALGPGVQARWVPLEHAHLTVRFIGSVADDRAALVLEALRAPLAIAPFDIVFGSCGVFPRSGPVRVIWMGIEQGVPSLTAMHDAFNRRLAPLGLEPEARPYSAHLTLARVKEGRGSAVRRTVASCAAPVTTSHVDHASVFQSLLSPKGARYERLLVVPCAMSHKP